MKAYNQFRRNTSQLQYRYNPPGKHNQFAESCRMTQRRTHWARKTRAEAQALMAQAQRANYPDRRNYYIIHNPGSAYPYAVGWETWKCSSTQTRPPARPSAAVQRVPRNNKVVLKAVSNSKTPSALEAYANSEAAKYATSNNMTITYRSPMDAKSSSTGMWNAVMGKSYSSGIDKVLVYYNAHTIHGTSFYRFKSYYLQMNQDDGGNGGNGGTGGTLGNLWERIVNWFKGIGDKIKEVGGTTLGFLTDNWWVIPLALIVVVMLVFKR